MREKLTKTFLNNIINYSQTFESNNILHHVCILYFIILVIIDLIFS